MNAPRMEYIEATRDLPADHSAKLIGCRWIHPDESKYCGRQLYLNNLCRVHFDVMRKLIVASAARALNSPQATTGAYNSIRPPS